ncbi:DTW domain-containing protein, partial [Acinetobacter baumannii]|uniref:DTW domain-containing protein n=1 Tax=Acinetobacter baumannii TaxID=470 RepID=UPI0028594547
MDAGAVTVARRAVCASCLRAQTACICQWIAPVAPQASLLVLLHPLEVGNAKNSGRLLHLSVAGSTLEVGEVFDADVLD